MEKKISFYVNGYQWDFRVVPEIQVDGSPKEEIIFGLTDYTNLEVLLRRGLKPTHQHRVLLHEVSHAYLFSYGIAGSSSVYNEEEVCNFVARYGTRIEETARMLELKMNGVDPYSAKRERTCCPSVEKHKELLRKKRARRS